METCCESLVKYFMIISNIIFALIGTILIGFGAYAQIEAKEYLNFLGDNYVNTPIFIIILGAIIFVISFFGCCGASKESKCMMYTYGFFLFLILIAQIGAGIAAFALKGDLKDAIEVNMKDGLQLYKNTTEFKTVWDAVQGNFECCGVEKPDDWYPIVGDNNVTDSCCQGGEAPECGMNKGPSLDGIYPEGCFTKFSEVFTSNLAIVGAVAVGVAVAELAICFVAYCMGKRMGRQGQFV
jgi:CD63 antigen